MDLVFSLGGILSKLESLDKLSDTEIVRLALEKDEYFEYLVYRHYGFLKALVFSLSSSKDEAEELFQEALWKLYNSLGTYKSEYSFKTWLRRLVLTTFISMKRKDRKTLSVEDLSDKGIGLSSEGPSEEDLDLESALKEALSKLPKDTRAIIYLRFKEGLSHEEIAEELKMSVEAVRKRLSRALKFLREVMSDEKR